MPRRSRRALPLRRPNQALAQKMALEVRRPVELAERLVAELAVKAGRLEAERVDKDRMGAALERSGFSGGDQPASDAPPTQPLRDEEITDEKPAGVGLAGEPRDDFVRFAPEDGEGLPGLMAWPGFLVEGLEIPRQGLHVRVRRFVLDVEAEP
jgi:hypothetical protein